MFSPNNMKRSFILILIACTIHPFVFGQNIKYKAVYIYNFTRHVEWPSSVNSPEFSIGIYNDDELAEEIGRTFAGKSLGNQVLAIKRFHEISQVIPCHILFIGTKSSAKIPDIIAKTSGFPTLIIGDKDGMIKNGACINFVYKDGKVLFELSKAAMQARSLKTSTYLENLAIIVNQ